MKLSLEAVPDLPEITPGEVGFFTASIKAVADVASLLTERDRLDRARAASPLYAAADAVLVDTTGKSVNQVVEEVLAIVTTVLDAANGHS